LEKIKQPELRLPMLWHRKIRQLTRQDNTSTDKFELELTRCAVRLA
jgi:hypothetical protein